MPGADKTLTCVQCGQPFVFTRKEQEFFAAKGLKYEPRRCRACRAARRAHSMPDAGGVGRAPAEVICAGCGQRFQPSSDKPVYCRACFQAPRST
jgi:CxxC-x17-CxxC domain-containing protein